MSNNRKGAVIARIVAVALMLMLVASSALASTKAYVYSDSMKVYKKASTSADKLGSLKEGTGFYITDYNSTWCKIEYKGYTGYALWKDIQLDDDERIKGYTTKKVAMYKNASASSTRLGTVAAGTLAYVAGRSGNYFLVQNKSGSINGYIHKNYLTTEKPEVEEDEVVDSSDSRTKMPADLKSNVSEYDRDYSNALKLEYAIYVAQNQLGKKYSTNPSEPKTFDCAGLVYYCYKSAGTKVSSSAQSQGYDDDFVKIEKISELRRGDMVCFNTNDTDEDLSDHTGIYIGDGKFLHASSGAGLVIVSDLESGYYERTFSWGRRILE